MTLGSGRPHLRAEEPFARLSSWPLPEPKHLKDKDFGAPASPWPRPAEDPLRRWSYLRCCFRVHP